MSEPSGIIKLIHRAPIDMTYQHQIDFKSPSEQLTYWDSKVKYSLYDYTYIRRERRSIKVNKSFDELEGVNYLYYRAKEDAKLYFCFVIDKSYINESTTNLYFEVDVFQTFMFDYTFKPTYVSQAHVDRWDANHLPKYSKTEEGLDYGTEYVTEAAFKIKPKDTFKHGFYLVYCVEHSDFVTSGAASEPTKVSNAPTPYVIYLLPSIEGFGEGEGMPAADPTTYTTVQVRYEADNAPDNPDAGAVTWTSRVLTIGGLQALMRNTEVGEFIKLIAYVPYLPFDYSTYHTGGDRGFVISGGPGLELATTNLGNLKISASFGVEFGGGGSATLIKIKNVDGVKFNRLLAEAPRDIGIESAIPSEEMWGALKANPRTTERDRRYESKLLCYPYRYNLLTDWVNSPVLIKNEYLAGDKISIRESFSFGFNFPKRYYVSGYRKDPEGREATLSQPMAFEQPITSSAYYTYLLENKNQIKADLTNAQWNYAAGAANVAAGTLNSVFSSGTPWQAAGAAVSGLFNGFNYTLQSKVNIANQVRSEAAKQADIRAVPDTVINSSDCSMAIIDETKYVTWYRKCVACEFQEQLAQFWHMYGYRVNSLITPNLRSRVRYNYIKTVGANIDGPIESNYMMALKAIFDTGITIWHYSATDFNPLDYTYENPEVLLL